MNVKIDVRQFAMTLIWMLTLEYEIAEIQKLKLKQPLSVYLLDLLDKCMKMKIEEVPTVDEILYEHPFYKHALPV